MFLIRFLRWLMGWVRLEAEGGFPERLLNLAARQDFQLWDTRRSGTSLIACCHAREYGKLRPLARKAGMRMRVRERHGAPFFLRRYRARAGIVAGLAVYAAMLLIFSQQIWVVEVSGNSRVPDSDILAVVGKLGVRQGGRGGKLNIPQLQMEALQDLPDLAWLTVNLKGSTALVEVTERILPSEMNDPDQPSNLKAARDGRIVEMVVYGGQAVAKQGDAVTKGMLLVSGVVDSQKGPILKRAQATILAETQRELTVRVPLEETQLLPTGQILMRPTFQLFGLHIPLYTDGPIDGEYTLDVRNHPLTANGVRLPLALVNNRYILLEQTLIQRGQEEAARLAAEQLAKKEAAELGKAQITSRSVAGKLEGNVYVLTGRYGCVEDIGAEEQIVVKKE